MGKVRFKDLSFWMKTAIIGGFIGIVTSSLEFIVGFILGITGQWVW